MPNEAYEELMELRKETVRLREVIVRLSEQEDCLRAVNAKLLAACEALCDAIELMGGLECFNELSGGDPDVDVDPRLIKDTWLDYVPVCKGDAYRAGRAAIADAARQQGGEEE